MRSSTSLPAKRSCTISHMGNNDQFDSYFHPKPIKPFIPSGKMEPTIEDIDDIVIDRDVIISAMSEGEECDWFSPFSNVEGYDELTINDLYALGIDEDFISMARCYIMDQLFSIDPAKY